MRERVLSALILLPAAVLLIVAGGVPFALGIALMTGAGTWEALTIFCAAARVTPALRWRAAASGMAALVVATAGVDRGALSAAVAVALVVGLLVLLTAGAPALHSVAWLCAVGAAVYVAGLATYSVLLRDSRDGLAWVVVACAVTWSTDTGAFFVGRSRGRHPFFQAISPKKTREGAAGGLLCGTAAAVAAGTLSHLAALPVLLALGVTGSAAGQAGDLLESMLKREAGVKDSGTLIPGHGGVLDRVDSLLVVLAVAWLWRIVLG